MNDGEEVVVVGNTNENTNKGVNMEKTDYVYKVVVIGDSAVGKSQILSSVYAFQGISCISEEESSRISLGMCSPLREEKNGQITAKKRSKHGIFPEGSCAPAQQC
ncbi:hypothetical protein AgCh_017913 [Apium graveolens]